MGEKQSKLIPLEYILNSFKNKYSGNNGVKLNPRELWTFFKIDWLCFEGAHISFNKEIITQVFRVVTGDSCLPV